MGEVIVITSGKGGVGKSTTTASLGVGLAMRGKKVALIDTDTGLRNLDILLGLERRIVYTLVDVAQKRVNYGQALVRHKKYSNLFLLPTSQVADKTAIEPEQMKQLVDTMRNEFDFILIDCPAGIEQGFQTAVIGADWAVVVTTPEVSAVRDADKIIGRLQAVNKDIKLIVNRIDPQMVKAGTMLDMTSIDDILSLPCIGQIPDDREVINASNQGIPIIEWSNTAAGRAYNDVVGRICGEDIPFKPFETDGFFARLKHVFGH